MRRRMDAYQGALAMIITNHKRLFISLWTIAIIGLAGSCGNPGQPAHLKLYSLRTRKTIAGPQALDALKNMRIVVVGEYHTDSSHHKAELRVIRFLKEHGMPLSIGLEMFRKNQQEALNRWISGEIDEADFEKIYYDNWNFPWALYRDIFIYARKHRIAMVGLNVSESVTRQVALHGFASLSPAQRGELKGIVCNVTPEYRDFIRSAFGAHHHDNMDFSHFCEAQLVWDTAMAINAIDYLNAHPDRLMVLLAGSGHARKMGIPYQIGERASIPVTGLLPGTPGVFEPDNLTTADADFIIMP
jgi:uncharacterized iron-regulated protein